jgi:hypothetical protein
MRRAIDAPRAAGVDCLVDTDNIDPLANECDALPPDTVQHVMQQSGVTAVKAAPAANRNPGATQ